MHSFNAQRSSDRVYARAIPVDLAPEIYEGVRGPAAMDGEVDEEYERVMALNAQLKAMLGEQVAADAVRAVSSGAPYGAAGEAKGDDHAHERGVENVSLRRRPRRGVGAGTRPHRRGASAAAAAAPTAPPPARRKPSSYTFGDQKLKEIGRDNRLLLEKMARITLGGGGGGGATAVPGRGEAKKIASSASINRRRRDDKIARENAAFAKRLAGVKASSSLSKGKMSEHKKQHKRLLNTMREQECGAGIGEAESGA